MAMKSLIPHANSNRDLGDWQTIKDIQASLSLIVKPSVVFNVLHGLSLRALS